MLENNVPSKLIARPWPRFNPHPILSTGKICCCNCHVLDVEDEAQEQKNGGSGSSQVQQYAPCLKL